jgi:hypothetical protein
LDENPVDAGRIDTQTATSRFNNRSPQSNNHKTKGPEIERDFRALKACRGKSQSARRTPCSARNPGKPNIKFPPIAAKLGTGLMDDFFWTKQQSDVSSDISQTTVHL